MLTLENAKHRKMRQKQNSDHNISQDRKDPECFVAMKAVKPDSLPFICPSRPGKIQPQLRSHGYNSGPCCQSLKIKNVYQNAL